MKHSLSLRLIAAVAVLLTLCGCNKENMRQRITEKLRVESLEKVSGSLADGWVITLRVKNMTRYTPVLTDGTAEVHFNDRKVARVRLLDKVAIPKRSESIVIDVPVSVSLSNPLQAYALWNAVRKGNYDGIDVSIDAHVKAAGATRPIAADRVPLETLMRKLGYKK